MFLLASVKEETHLDGHSYTEYGFHVLDPLPKITKLCCTIVRQYFQGNLLLAGQLTLRVHKDYGPRNLEYQIWARGRAVNKHVSLRCGRIRGSVNPLSF
jgi:hypothetical protein